MNENRNAPELRERSIPELLKQLSQETTTLVRQELDLAKAEVAEKGKRQGWAPGCSAAPASPRCWVWVR